MEEISNLTGNKPQWVKNITDCYQFSEWEKVCVEVFGKKLRVPRKKEEPNRGEEQTLKNSQ
nr:hypothetical protein [Marseillevirus cajuinensis]